MRARKTPHRIRQAQDGLCLSPTERVKSGGSGVGYWRLWFDTGLRKTPARLTTNG